MMLVWLRHIVVAGSSRRFFMHVKERRFRFGRSTLSSDEPIYAGSSERAEKKMGKWFRHQAHVVKYSYMIRCGGG